MLHETELFGTIRFVDSVIPVGPQRARPVGVAGCGGIARFGGRLENVLARPSPANVKRRTTRAGIRASREGRGRRGIETSLFSSVGRRTVTKLWRNRTT